MLVPQRTIGKLSGVLVTPLLCLMSAFCWVSSTAFAESGQPDFTQLTIEQLMNVEVTSVAKKEQKLAMAAAAIFVITQEDIRRSGVTSLPEALRLAPGVEVARIDASKWAISARGFNGRFSNKLLVLIDGRSVYTPLFSGVFWDVQDMLLEDVERIEVIRGPGATLWGANAVNGIINIITKQAQDSQGGLVTAGGGTEEQGFGGVRYGAKLGNEAYVRAYVKYFNRDGLVDGAGSSTPDDWQVLRGGFRLDWQASTDNRLTVQGDIYDGTAGGVFTSPSFAPPFMSAQRDTSDLSGGNVLTRWQHTLARDSVTALQLYYDRTERREFAAGETRDTFDLDFQHRFVPSPWLEIVWGLGYRATRDSITNTFIADFQPTSRNVNLFSSFVQADIALIEQRLRLTLGSKFEHNDYSGFEVQPNIRLLWTPHARHTLWAAVSRAVRTPSRFEHDARITLAVIPPGSPQNPAPLPGVVALLGTRDFDSEDLLAYELGYRLQAQERLSFDLAVFYNAYTNFRSLPLRTPFLETTPPPARLVIPTVTDNAASGEVFGVELAADWRPLDWWRLQLAYSYLQIQLHGSSTTGFFSANLEEGQSPRHQLSLRSSLDLTRQLEFDAWFRYVDALRSIAVPSYLTFDLRLAWKPSKSLEIALVGQNLLQSHHLEFVPELLSLPSEVQRSVYGKFTWRF